MRLATAAVGAFALSFAACASPRAAEAPAVPALTLVDTAGGTTTLPDDLAHAKVTVVVFYADHCPVFGAHEERLRQLARAYADRGVRMILVDSEVSATAERDAHAASEHRLPAIVLDPGARLADALGADYATFTVVFDAHGRARYRGGFDADKERLHDDAEAYVKNAVEDLLADREPRKPEGKTLGCALQKR
jgi:peroxiredoxin